MNWLKPDSDDEWRRVRAIEQAARDLADREPIVEDPEGIGGAWCLYCDKQTPGHEKWCDWAILRAALAVELT